MRNLLFLHLESISRQTLAVFASSFPNVRALIGRSVWFPNHFAAATSTLMALAYLWHGNDRELDHNALHDNARNAHLNENLFALLSRHGYRSEVLCFDVYRAQRPTRISIWPEDLDPIWASEDPAAFVAHFAEALARPPFAIYCWNMLSHIEHSGLFAGLASGLTDQLRRAYEGVDRMVGEMLAALERAGRLSDTLIVAFGDHGDDFWTHGYKAGFLHGTEPTTDLTWTPLSIFDARRAPSTHEGLASSIDLYRTSLGLLDLPAGPLFEPSGIDLFADDNEVVFSQNYFAAQPDSSPANVLRAFAAANATYNLVASSRGCELYAYRLDPGNHCNLLRLFEPLVGGGLRLRGQAQESGHFWAALRAPPANAADIVANFESLRAALRAHLDGKRRYLHARPSGQSLQLLDPDCLERISAHRRDEFYFAPEVPPAPALRQTSLRLF